MLRIWFGLGRNLDADKNKVIGRKQFVDFAWDCIHPIHSDIEHHTINKATRTIQKSLKSDERLKLKNTS